MDYVGNIFRPPVEHNSILLQVTTGCSHNKCTFCGMFKDKSFSIKEMEIIEKDLDYAACHFPHKKRLFLCDGDALTIPFERLLTILKKIKEKLPWVRRVGTYGSAKSVRLKSDEELKILKEHSLSMIFFGLESGDDEVLKAVKKGSDCKTQIEQAKRVKQAGMKISLTVLLGLASREGSSQHAKKTGEAISEIGPNHVGALSMMMAPEVPLYKAYRKGNFEIMTPLELLQELKTMITCTNLEKGIFSANHASNYLPMQIRFPSGKQEALSLLDKALQGEVEIKPEWMRGL